MKTMAGAIAGQKKSVRIILAVMAVFVLATLLTGCGKAEESVGVIDVSKIMSESPKVKKFQEDLNAKGKELSDDLEKEQANLSQEEFQARQEAAYGEFLKIRQDMEAQIEQTIKTAVEEVGKERKLGVIIFKNTVAFGGVDITDDVLKKMQ